MQNESENSKKEINQRELFKERRQKSIIFCVVFLLYMIWLCKKKSMTIFSIDAMDNWKSIVTWFSAERYGSYTLYKGFGAIYPYVWLYQLAEKMHLNEFFFCMVYYAILFAYLTTVGIPFIAEKLTDWKPYLWQRMILPIFFFVIWEYTNALSELMVDLPSCAYFIMAVSCAITLPEQNGWKNVGRPLLGGLLAGLCANISGQYSLSALCLILLNMVLILKKNKENRAKRIRESAGQVIALLVGFATVKLLNIAFMKNEIAPMVANGAWIPEGNMWLERGLLYFIDKNRYLDVDLLNPRGFAILQDIYGSESAAYGIQELAGNGYAGWSVLQFLEMVLHYPVDAVVQALDKFFLAFSVDLYHQSVVFLTLGYSLFYISGWNVVKRIKHWRDFLSPKTLVVLAAVCSLIPSMVMALEMRVAIGAQSIVFGTALMCGSIPQTLENGIYHMSRGRYGKMHESVGVGVYLVWFIFLLLCLMHIGTLYAQSDLGTEMLFNWY